MIAGGIVALVRVVSGASVRWTAAPESIIRQRVYFGNHSSHLDFVVIWSALPKELREVTRPVAGKDYWDRGPVRRFLAGRVFRAILIDRPLAKTAEQASKSVEQIAAEMGTNCSIIVFPEGTRSPTGELQQFKSGLYHLCRLKPDLELIPVYLANMNRILPKGELLPVPLLGRVIFGAPMRLQPGEAKDAFLSRTRDALLALRDQ